jgi:hypothetical protein
LLLAAGLPGCKDPPISVKDALQAARHFIDALIALERASQVFQSRVAKTVLSTKDQLAQSSPSTSPKVDLPRVASNWEAYWAKVVEDTTTLQKKFEEVEAASKGYWDILEKVTNQIEDRTLRAAEKAKNQTAKEKWDKAYDAARLQIARATSLRDKGNDFGRTMLAAALRRQLAEYTDTLDLIAREAETLLRSLETLTEQGKSIVTAMQ